MEKKNMEREYTEASSPKDLASSHYISRTYSKGMPLNTIRYHTHFECGVLGEEERNFNLEREQETTYKL